VEIVHTHGDAASMIALPLLRLGPAITTTHGLSLLRRLAGARRATAARAFAAVAAGCETVICTSATEREELTSVVRDADQGKLRLIPNGIDPPARFYDSDRAALRRELAVDASTVLGVFVGQLEAHKAPLLAAHAAVRARAAGAPFVLAVLGDGPQMPDLEALPGDAIRVLGYRSDVARILAAADVFVQPSEREGMSFALLEAMTHSLPIVAADGAGAPEAIGDAGLLFPTGDETALVTVLNKLTGDPCLRASLGNAARARVQKRFSALEFLAATEAVYAQSIVTRDGTSSAVDPAMHSHVVRH
jgi:glycosyltransferase involved in cell wall biosynthesis